jgi:hypothetical protein
MKKWLLAASCLAAAAVFVASALAGSSTSGRMVTEHYYLHFRGSTNGVPKLKPGATVTAHSAVYDRRGGRLLGRTSELCVETVAKPFTMQCSSTVIMGANTFTVEGGYNPAKTPYTAALVGGTGRYAGAHGMLVARTAPGEAESWTITYTR